MPTFVTLIRFTEQGAGNFKDTARRAAAFRDTASKAGVTVREQLWTLGTYDGVLVLEAADEQTVAAVMMNLSSLGNVRTQTLPAFEENEISQIVSRAGGGGGSGGGGTGGAKGAKRGR